MQNIPPELTVKVIDLNHDGEAVGVLDNGKKVFFFGALPGEEVNITIQEQKRNVDLGKLNSILIKSPNRIEPVCEHFATCGGCNLQYLAPSAQVELKQKSFLKQLKKFAGVEPKYILSPLLSPNVGYRNRARFGVRYILKQAKIAIGFRERHSRHLANLNSCKVLNPRVADIIPDLNKLIASLKSYEKISHLEVAIGDLEAALILRILNELPEQDKVKLKSFAALHNLQVYLQPKATDSIYKIWPEDNIMHLSYKLDNGIEILFHPGDFTQINPYINKQMVTQAINLLNLTASDVVLDLFCGLGNFTLPIAKQAGQVIGIEGSTGLVNRALENAKHNNIDNVEFYLKDLMQKNIDLSFLKNKKITKLILDPPRAGAKECIRIVAKLKPKLILYISCDPATLARDSKEIIALGYNLEAAGIMDMFSHTMHIESMVLFSAK